MFGSFYLSCSGQLWCQTRQVPLLATCNVSHSGPTLWASLARERRSAATAVHVSSHKALSQLLILHSLLTLHDFIDSVCITLFVRLSVVIFIPLYLLYRTTYFFFVLFLICSAASLRLYGKYYINTFDLSSVSSQDAILKYAVSALILIAGSCEKSSQ